MVRNKITPNSTFQSINCATVSRFNHEEWAPLPGQFLILFYLEIYITFYSTHYVLYIRHNNIDERRNPKHLMIDACWLLKYWHPPGTKCLQIISIHVSISEIIVFPLQKCKEKCLIDWLENLSDSQSIFSLTYSPRTL